jgi:T-complex protein 1 subunit eta
VAGVAFKKTFSYAGFEMQPKSYTDPKIALLNIELELKSEKENAELRIENVEVSTILVNFWLSSGWHTELFYVVVPVII